MLFWVAVIIIIACAIGYARFFFDDFGFFIPLLMWLLSTGVTGFLILAAWAGLGHAFSTELKSDNTYRTDLRALDSGSGIEGRHYFLGGGYVNNKRVLNFIVRNEDGSSSLGYTDANESRIFEDTAEKPYMLTKEKNYGNWWFAFDSTIRTERTYEYHIPAGSVLESTQITNK